MKCLSTAVVALSLTLSSTVSYAAELRVLAGGAMTAVWAEIKPKFEQASGHKLDIFYGTTPNLIKEATSGKAFDVGIVPVEVMQDAAARAKFAGGATLDIARVGLGVAVRAGAPKPDISTPDALKATLFKAHSVASIPASATGYSIAKVFDRLGINEPMKTKMKAQPTPAEVVAAVAKGEAELTALLAAKRSTDAAHCRRGRRLRRALPSEPRPHAAHRPGWLHEIKHDGYRMMVRRDGRGIRVFSSGRGAALKTASVVAM
jgi:molybdate transport system substrate-binding protein